VHRLLSTPSDVVIPLATSSIFGLPTTIPTVRSAIIILADAYTFDFIHPLSSDPISKCVATPFDIGFRPPIKGKTDTGPVRALYAMASPQVHSVAHRGRLRHKPPYIR
jgi:hypothetical protein